MAITELSVLPRGTRIRIVRGPLPSDAGLIGREGAVFEHSVYFPNKVQVALDGETEIRTFVPVELEVVGGPDSMPLDRSTAKNRLVRP